MAKRPKRSADRDRGKFRDQIQAWRQHPDDPWAELERLGLTEDVIRLGWSHTRVTRAMNSVASAEKFKLKLHRAMQTEGDKPLHLASGVGRPSTPEEEHGYSYDAGRALDPHAEVIDLPTLGRLQEQSAEKRAERVGDLIVACEEIRAAVDERVRRNPDFMSLAGRDIWVLRSKIDAMMRDLKRKAA